MINLRDKMSQGNLYDSPLEAVLAVLSDPEVVVEPEDVVDYVLNPGHRHRLVEGWELRFGHRSTTHFEANHYPERMLFYALACRVIDQVFAEPLGVHMKGFIRARHGFEPLDEPVLYDTDIQVFRAFEEEESKEKTVLLGREFKALARVERLARKRHHLFMGRLSNEEVGRILAERRMRLPPEDILLRMKGVVPMGNGAAIGASITHFISHFGTKGLEVFRGSETFRTHYES